LAITNGYCTLAEVKAALRIPNADTIDDTILEGNVEAASRLIDGYTMRSFYNAGTAVRYFAPDNAIYLPIDDAISISEVATSSDIDSTYDVIWATTDYQKEPLNGRVDGLGGWPTTGIRAIDNYDFYVNNGQALARVTGVWGWSAVPIAIKQATIIQASRIFKRLDSPLGVLSSPDMGFIRVGHKLDPDVQMLVSSYRLMRNLA
jgi:hypothetical protein